MEIRMESTDPATGLAGRLLTYLQQKKFDISTLAGQINIIYVEGLNPDGTPNDDAADGWNDLRCLVDVLEDGTPRLLLCVPATTEPGRMATLSPDAAARGGVARIAFGQYKAWRMGYHNQRKNGKNHPALVQAAPLPVHRDRNRDGKRTGDNLYLGMFGINQHGTRPGYRGDSVANWSEGCLVGMDWERHLKFIDCLRADPRYVADPNFMFTAAIIAGDDFCRVSPA